MWILFKQRAISTQATDHNTSFFAFFFINTLINEIVVQKLNIYLILIDVVSFHHLFVNVVVVSSNRIVFIFLPFGFGLVRFVDRKSFPILCLFWHLINYELHKQCGVR